MGVGRTVKNVNVSTETVTVFVGLNCHFHNVAVVFGIEFLLHLELQSNSSCFVSLLALLEAEVI